MRAAAAFGRLACWKASECKSSRNISFIDHPSATKRAASQSSSSG
jgi:hypothetical protein